MDNTSFPANVLHDPRRRLLLSGLVTTCASLVITFATAQPRAQPKLQFATGVPAAAPASFLELSQILTGRSAPDASQAGLLYQALVYNDAGFDIQHRQLLAIIKDYQIDPIQLQKVLDAQKSALAPVPREIVTAWYTGIVGAGERAKCVTFETNLLNLVTADKLKPPSYAYGVYGSWATKPV